MLFLNRAVECQKQAILGKFRSMFWKLTSSILVRCVLQAGEELTVSFDIDAREWQGRWFNSIRAWKVERPSQNAGMQPQPADYSFPPVSSAPVPPADFSATDEKDDLPF